MPKYRVSADLTISVSTVVEAESETEAADIANSREKCSLMSCERMGDSEENVWCHSGELDGEPIITGIEEES